MNFYYDDEAIRCLKAKDPILADVIDRIGPIERPIDADLFSALVNNIVGQQISTKAFITIWNRIKDLFGTVTPESILSKSAEELQKCGITMKKSVYIRNIAVDIINGSLNLDELYELPDDEVCRRLSSLNGIGTWTAEMLMTFSMQRPDILSWDDLAIRRGIMMLYRHKKLDKNLLRDTKKDTPRMVQWHPCIYGKFLWENNKGEINMKKLPPVEKIYEAYSALSDNRVIMEENSAKVFSSDKSKEYPVLYMLHGANGSNNDWLNGGKINANASTAASSAS